MQRLAFRGIVSLLAATVVAGCASGGATTLADLKQEQLRSLTIRCYMENREALRRSNSPGIRAACREWAQRRVDV